MINKLHNVLMPTGLVGSIEIMFLDLVILKILIYFKTKILARFAQDLLLWKLELLMVKFQPPIQEKFLNLMLYLVALSVLIVINVMEDVKIMKYDFAAQK